MLLAATRWNQRRGATISDSEETVFGWTVRAHASPLDDIGRLFSARRSARQALLAYAYRGLDSTTKATARVRKLRREAVKTILNALGRHPPDWTAGLKAARTQERRLRTGALRRDGWEIASDIRKVLIPLLRAFADPRRFFTEIAPRLSHEDFDQAALLEEDGVNLGLALSRWGIAALLNPAVARAFRSKSIDISVALTLQRTQPTLGLPGRKEGWRWGKKVPRRPVHDWEGRLTFFDALARFLDGERRLTTSELKNCVSVLSGSKRFEAFKRDRTSLFPTMAARSLAYRHTADEFGTTVVALKKGFQRDRQRHRNSP